VVGAAAYYRELADLDAINLVLCIIGFATIGVGIYSLAMLHRHTTSVAPTLSPKQRPANPDVETGTARTVQELAVSPLSLHNGFIPLQEIDYESLFEPTTTAVERSGGMGDGKPGTGGLIPRVRGAGELMHVQRSILGRKPIVDDFAYSKPRSNETNVVNSEFEFEMPTRSPCPTLPIEYGNLIR
jgi:hypothetical protein